MSVNINNVSYDDFKDICRMCMLNCDIKFFMDCVTSTIFLKLIDLHPETNDDLPKQICQNCFEKIKEIHEFALKCKQTHTTLMECLNNQKNVNQNETIERKCEIPTILDDQFKSEYIKDKSLNLTDKMEINYESNDIILEASDIKEEVIENIDLPETSYNLTKEIIFEEHKIEFVKAEHFVDESSEINNEENIFESVDDLLTPNTSNIYSGNDENLDLNNRSSDESDSESNNKNLDGKFNIEHLKCPKSFTHIRTHSGERPFKCDQCSKSFNKKVYLHRHLRTHIGERPFKCDQCSKSFAQSNNLDRHLRTHSGERPFKCDQCSKSFSDLGNMKRHKRTHSRERLFECEQCKKSFKLLVSLKSHMTNQHGSNKRVV